MERGGWFKGQDFHDQNEEEGKDDLLPAGEQLGPHQLSVKLLFRRLEGTRLPSIIIVTTTIKKNLHKIAKGYFLLLCCTSCNILPMVLLLIMTVNGNLNGDPSAGMDWN